MRSVPFMCGATTELTPEEYQQLDELPDGANLLEVEKTCWLNPGHPGHHMTLGQACGMEKAEWWLRWGGEVRSIDYVDMCPTMEEDSPRECLLPVGHWGDHDFGG